MSVILPLSHQADALNQLKGSVKEHLRVYPSFLLRNINLSFFLSYDVATFFFEQNHCGFSSQLSWIDPLPEGNGMAILPNGHMFLMVDLDTYQRLGLAGYELKKYRPRDNSYRLLRLDLLELLKAGASCRPSKILERLRWSLSPPHLNLVSVEGFFQSPFTGTLDYFVYRVNMLIKQHGTETCSATLNPVDVRVTPYTGAENPVTMDFSSSVPAHVCPNFPQLKNELLTSSESDRESLVEELLEYTGKILLNVQVEEQDYSWATSSRECLVCVVVRSCSNGLLCGSSAVYALLHGLTREFSSQQECVRDESREAVTLGWIISCTGSPQPVQSLATVASFTQGETGKNVRLLRDIAQGVNWCIGYANQLDECLYFYGPRVAQGEQDTKDCVISIHSR